MVVDSDSLWHFPSPSAIVTVKCCKRSRSVSVSTACSGRSCVVCRPTVLGVSFTDHRMIFDCWTVSRLLDSFSTKWLRGWLCCACCIDRCCGWRSSLCAVVQRGGHVLLGAACWWSRAGRRSSGVCRSTCLCHVVVVVDVDWCRGRRQCVTDDDDRRLAVPVSGQSRSRTGAPQGQRTDQHADTHWWRASRPWLSHEDRAYLTAAFLTSATLTLWDRRSRRRRYCGIVLKRPRLHFWRNLQAGWRFLAFTFAICYRPSVCLSVVCRLSVCNVRAPYSGGSDFRQYFYGIRYHGHPWTSTENFTEIVPGEPLRRGS